MERCVSSGSVTFAADPRQVRAARQLVRSACSDAGTTADMCDVAVLLTSETVTNAIIHGGTSVNVNVTADRDAVRVEVSDGNSNQPVVRNVGVDTPSGRGMCLVSAMATRWGVTDRQLGKTVWFELRPPWLNSRLSPVLADSPERF